MTGDIRGVEGCSRGLNRVLSIERERVGRGCRERDLTGCNRGVNMSIKYLVLRVMRERKSRAGSYR